jgi:hypothetical protein
MSQQVEFEVLDASSNAIVARSPDRQFPGVLVQGDTLRILLGDIAELRMSLENGDHGAAVEAAGAVEDRLRTLLVHYERALKSHGRALPYSVSVLDEE